nr:hypothetical protein [uncultured Marinifilum sp.]
MKRNIIVVGMLLFFSAAIWSCSDSDSPKTQDQDQNLEQSLELKTKTLSEAVGEITASPGFELITMSGSTKEGTEEESDDRFSFTREISLEDIQGIYEYTAAGNEEATETKMYRQHVFEKTGDSELFIIHLPQEKATKPWKLYMEEEGDAELDNDFEVSTSQYHSSTLMNNEGFKFDYLLDADITIEEEPAGEIFVDWNMNKAVDKNFEYVSEFGFANGYSVGHKFMFGDTTEFAYSLKMGEEVLYMEEVEYVRSNNEFGAQYEYALTIGDIKIVKNSDSDEYLVYRGGELQEDAIIEIIDDTTVSDGENEGEEQADGAFCRRAFDIKITFADETSVILSDLIGEETLAQLDKIYSSMYDMYFVKTLVDIVATEAYQINMDDNSDNEDNSEE